MNPLIAALPPSLIREVNARKRPGDVDLGLGEPVFRPHPEPFRRAVRWVEENGCPYGPIPGSLDLREAVGRYVGASAERVLITHGSEEAVYLALRAAVDPARDEVLLVEPAYPAYEKICQMEGLAYRVVALSEADGFRPRAEPVLAALGPRTRLVVIASPANPTGRVWGVDELRRLAAGLGDVGVLTDEVYRELYYTPERPPSMADFHPRTLVAGSLSKSHAVTGMRLGWLVAPPDLHGAAQRAHQLMTTSASTLSQRVAVELLGGPRSPHREAYRERRAALLATLRDLGLRHVPPEGAFYCLVAIPGFEGGGDRRARSLEAAFGLLERERVVTVPGVAFGEACAGWLRVSWVPEPAVVAEGLRRMARFFGGMRA